MDIFGLIKQKSDEDTIIRNLLEEKERLLKKEEKRLKHQNERKRIYREKVKKNR